MSTLCIAIRVKSGTTDAESLTEERRRNLGLTVIAEMVTLQSIEFTTFLCDGLRELQ